MVKGGWEGMGRNGNEKAREGMRNQKGTIEK